MGDVLRSQSGQSVYEAVRTQILTLAMRPGHDVDEMALVAEFGVSRTPVREALIRLAAEGLVVLRPNKGAQVAPLAFEELPAMIEALELNERATIRRAAARRSEEDIQQLVILSAAFDQAVRSGDVLAVVQANWRFHDRLNRASNNRFLAEDASRALTRMLRISTLIFKQPGALKGRIVSQHDGMIEALRRHDADLADRLIVEHNEEVRVAVAQYVEGSRTCDIDVG